MPKVSRRSTLLATLLALILAPFQRLFDLFNPKPKLPAPKGWEITGVDEYVDMGNVADFDHDEEFSVSCWFKTTPTDDKNYLFDLKGPTRKISETTLLDDIEVESSGPDKDGWYHMVAEYDGGSTKDLEIFVDGRPLGAPPLDPDTIVLWGDPPVTLPTLAKVPRRTVYKPRV